MSSAPLAPVSRVDQVTSAIRQAILTGQLEPGKPFKVNELAISLGVSIIPVREALQRLAAVGLIELRPARTSVVSPLSADDLKEIYRLRELLEGDAIGRSVPLLDDDDLELLRLRFGQMADLRPSSEEFWDVHQGFHRSLIGPVLTARLRHAMTPLWEATERYTRLVYDEIGFRPGGGRPEVAHRPILEAAEAGDIDAARGALVVHYEENVAWMLDGLSTIDSRAREGDGNGSPG
jgi:DNA-binding GntR family transcriptional regulator